MKCPNKQQTTNNKQQTTNNNSSLIKFFLLLALLVFTACGGGGGGGGSTSGTSDDSSTATNTNTPASSTTTVPWNFVNITGSTVTGSDKFKVGNETGCFVAGRNVTINNFSMLDHEITQAEYQSVMGSNPSYFDGTSGKEAETGETQANRPVDMVSWYDALVYCNKKSMADGLTPCYAISGKTNPAEWGAVPTSNDATWDGVTCNFSANGYRLPTEAEWEYAALGGAAGVNAADPTDYAGPNTESNLGSYAWNSSNSGAKTHEVRKKTANALNLFDLSGNVIEWCWDWYGSLDSSTDYAGPNTESNLGSYAWISSCRVLRGGTCYDAATSCSAAYRSGAQPSVRSDGVGFRVVRSAQ